MYVICSYRSASASFNSFISYDNDKLVNIKTCDHKYITNE